MTVKELKEILNQYDDSTLVFVGCEGYHNMDDLESETRVETVKGCLLISDSCYYESIQKGGKGMKTKEQLFEEYCERNFNKYFDYYITETDTMTALKKSFKNNWSFADCKKYF